MSKKLDGNAVAFSRQPEPPQSWRFWPIPDDGVTPFNGRILIDGYVVQVKFRRHQINPDDPSVVINYHFLFSSHKRASGDFELLETHQGGLGAQHRQPGHSRLIHLVECPGWPLARSSIDALTSAAHLGKKIIIGGSTLLLEPLDPGSQRSDVYFDGWDNTSKCPVLVIDRIEDAPTEGLARFVAGAKPVLKSIFLMD